MHPKQIPIIDLFAGPGGLGEGFSSVSDSGGNKVFQIRLSIEKDPVAHQTLALRALFRSLSSWAEKDRYYEYVRGEITREEFLNDPTIAPYVEHACLEARCATLGETPAAEIDEWIREALQDADPWVLIGGPPCQAYSLAGRSRMRGADPAAFEGDKRHLLYKEYLRIIEKFRPTVFVMENVKGILSSKLKGQPIFEQILKDLSHPSDELEYEMRSFVTESCEDKLDPHEFVIHAEDYGVPQMRHRVILLGVRKDFAGRKHEVLKPHNVLVSVRRVLTGLPKIRSRLSKEPDSHQAWLSVLKGTTKELGEWTMPKKSEIKASINDAITKAFQIDNVGSPFIPCQITMSTKLPIELASWLHDPLLRGVCQHESRSHMRSDLHRYMFAASYASVVGGAPKLKDFPPSLLPKHKNLDDEDTPFVDRFKVQLASKPSKTIVSHISKDGHYYIHHDPAQCRSYSVREAARLQTFPDNYFFVGNRTQQYVQVGNAVPPYLARQLGKIVADFLAQSALAKGETVQRELGLSVAA